MKEEIPQLPWLRFVFLPFLIFAWMGGIGAGLAASLYTFNSVQRGDYSWQIQAWENSLSAFIVACERNNVNWLPLNKNSEGSYSRHLLLNSISSEWNDVQEQLGKLTLNREYAENKLRLAVADYNYASASGGAITISQEEGDLLVSIRDAARLKLDKQNWQVKGLLLPIFLALVAFYIAGVIAYSLIVGIGLFVVMAIRKIVII